MRSLRFWLLPIAVALSAGALGAQQNNVRIVRLSLVVGAVEMSLPGAAPARWTPAMLNAPVIQGERLRTLASGRAEVQLENGSTLRLIPGSELDFTQLAQDGRGEFLTRARLAAGTAFVTLRKPDSKGFALVLPNEQSIALEGDGSFRADAADLAVYDGKAKLQAGSRELTLDKNHQIALAPKLG
ncbi:MAG: FecR domain-containing protein, partial [Terriglobales bacterium]